MTDDKVIPGLPAGNLAEVLGRIVDHFVGPKRILDRASAYANAAVVAAKADAEIYQLQQQSQARLENVELRRQRNINNISAIAEATVPSRTFNTADKVEPSEDFVFRFFSDCADIGDPELQILWGKLLADEVARPGSFHPQTLAILKNMTKEDTFLLEKLCKMIFVFGSSYHERVPIFLDEEPQYKDLLCGLDFDNISHLEALGLLHHNSMGYEQNEVGTDIVIRHFNRFIEVKFALPKNSLFIGGVLLTRAGSELSKLATVEPLPGLFEAVLEIWKRRATSAEEIFVD